MNLVLGKTVIDSYTLVSRKLQDSTDIKVALTSLIVVLLKNHLISCKDVKYILDMPENQTLTKETGL